MGGLITLHMSLKKPELFNGMILIAPLIYPAADSMPPQVVVYIAQAINWISPTLALVEANLGKNSSDIKTEEQFHQDPYTYSGKMRVGTVCNLLQHLYVYYRV